MRSRFRRNRSLVIALYINAALLLSILVALLARGNSGAAFAAIPAPQPIAGGANLYLMPAQFSANKWGCYILDIDAQTLLAYYYSPKNDGTDLQLVAARKITYDRRLTNFNSTDPSWMEVKKWVDQAAEGIRGQDTGIPPSKSTEKGNTEQSTPPH
jgi:hypothetical protein